MGILFVWGPGRGRMGKTSCEFIVCSFELVVFGSLTIRTVVSGEWLVARRGN